MKPTQQEPSEPTLENLSKALIKRGFSNKIEKGFVSVTMQKGQTFGYTLNGLEMLFGKRISKTPSKNGYFIAFYL